MVCTAPLRGTPASYGAVIAFARVIVGVLAAFAYEYVRVCLRRLIARVTRVAGAGAVLLTRFLSFDFVLWKAGAILPSVVGVGVCFVMWLSEYFFIFKSEVRKGVLGGFSYAADPRVVRTGVMLDLPTSEDRSGRNRKRILVGC